MTSTTTRRTGSRIALPPAAQVLKLCANCAAPRGNVRQSWHQITPRRRHRRLDMPGLSDRLRAHPPGALGPVRRRCPWHSRTRREAPQHK